MRVILSVFILWLMIPVGCSKANTRASVVPDRLPLTEQARQIAVVPKYLPPIETGEVKDVSKGEDVPFDGICLTEDKAMSAAELRIAYNEIYRLYLSNSNFMLAIVSIQEQELYRADAMVKEEKNKIDEIQNSWWQRHKLAVGITVGIIAGSVLTLGAGSIWSKIDNK